MISKALLANIPLRLIVIKRDGEVVREDEGFFAVLVESFEQVAAFKTHPDIQRKWFHI